jgi:hypothetical protein
MVQLDICGLQNNVWDLWWCLVMLCKESLNLEHFKFIRIIELVIRFRTFSFTIIVNLSKGCQDFFWYSEVWEFKELSIKHQMFSQCSALPALVDLLLTSHTTIPLQVNLLLFSQFECAYILFTQCFC